jgi:filamentous hemagglutinin
VRWGASEARIALVLVFAGAAAGRAEVPAVQFSPLRIENGQLGGAIGVKVTAAILSDGLVGRVCLARFRLEQGERRWEESSRRPVQVKQWEERGFYKRSFLSERFDSHQPVQISFALIDLVNQTELGQVTGTIPPEGSAPLAIEHVKIVHRGRVVHEGRVDLQATWARIQRGEKLPKERSDGAVFSNRGSKLPTRAKGYWREWIHPTDGLNGAGPQRLIVGEQGEIYYTPDQGKSYTQLR